MPDSVLTRRRWAATCSPPPAPPAWCLAAAGAEDSAANVHSGNAFLGMEVADGGPLA